MGVIVLYANYPAKPRGWLSWHM